MTDHDGTIVLLPYAGAQIDPFGLLRTELHELGFDGLWTMTYPGHGARSDQPLAETIQALVQDTLEQIQNLPRPIHFIGYSMGGIVAYEAALRLADAAQTPGSLAFMSTVPPPAITSSGLDFSDDDRLVEYCTRWGLVDARLFAIPEIRATFLPPLRQDIKAVEIYASAQRRDRRLPPEVDVAVFLGAHDATVAVDEDEWMRITVRQPSIHIYPGGHFFAHDCAWAVARDYALFRDRNCFREGLQ